MYNSEIIKKYFDNLSEKGQDLEDKAIEYGASALQKAEPVLKVLGYPGGLVRGAIAGGLEAATGRDDLVDIKDVLKGEAPGSSEIMEKLGVKEGGSLSDIAPSLYSETGKGLKLQKGGLFDPTARGVAGLAADIITDPLTYATAGAAKAIGRGAELAEEAPRQSALKRILGNQRGAIGEDLPKLNERGFYYKLDKVLSDKMGPVESPERVMNLLSEIKPEEIKHSKVLNFIQKAKDEGKKINKQEILDYIQNNRINIERLQNIPKTDQKNELQRIERETREKVLDLKENLEAVINQELNAGRYELPEKKGIFDEPGDTYDAEGFAHFLSHWAGDNRGLPAPDFLKDLPKPIEEAMIELGKAKLKRQELEKLIDLHSRRSPQWEGTNLTPGSFKNYRESLIQYLKPWSDLDNPAGHFNEFYGSHFNDPDIIAHSRTASYRDADNNLYHHSSEHQSDLHQGGTSGLYESEKEQFAKMYEDFENSPEFRASMDKAQQEKNALINSEPMEKYRKFKELHIDPMASKHQKMADEIENLKESIFELKQNKNVEIENLYNELDNLPGNEAKASWEAANKKYDDQIEKLEKRLNFLDTEKQKIYRSNVQKEQNFHNYNPEVRKIERKIAFLEEKLTNKRNLSSSDIRYRLPSFPDAPLKTAWQEHLIKQDLIDAARKDAEYYSWSTGKQQALQNATQDVKVTYSYDPKKGTVTIKRQTPKEGADFRVKDFNKPENIQPFEYPPEYTEEKMIEHINYPQELLQNIGPVETIGEINKLPAGIVKKLLKTKPDENGIINVTKTTASSLGARHHYDIMTPSMIKSLLKKFNPQIELYVNPGGGFGEQINRVRLTPEMKQYILKYGFPMYMLPFMMGTEGEKESEKPEFKQIKSKLKG